MRVPTVTILTERYPYSNVVLYKRIYFITVIPMVRVSAIFEVKSYDFRHIFCLFALLKPRYKLSVPASKHRCIFMHKSLMDIHELQRVRNI